MSILEVTEFSGRAQVLGAVREVTVAQNQLIIRGVNMEDANRILNHLAIGLQSVQLPMVPQQGPQQAPVSDPKAAVTAAPLVADTPVAKPPKKSESKSLPVQAPKPQVEDDLPGDLGQNGKGPPSEGNAAIDASTPKVEPATPPIAGDEAELVTKLSGYKKLGDILFELHERGFTSAESMLEVCERLQQQVPVLRTIPSLPDRIQRAREAVLGSVG